MLSSPLNLNKTLLLPFWVKNEPTNILFSPILDLTYGRSTIVYTMQISERKKNFSKHGKAKKWKYTATLCLMSEFRKRRSRSLSSLSIVCTVKKTEHKLT